MSEVNVIPLTEPRFDDFVALVVALADYEKLDPPDAAAIERLRRDAFSNPPRFVAYLAQLNGQPVGYAIAFETYSSFLAKPTMYLEDLFVLERARKFGIGNALFDTVRDLGLARGCGRMDWQVLDWNELAIGFYKHKNAEFMKSWYTYRITFP